MHNRYSFISFNYVELIAVLEKETAKINSFYDVPWSSLKLDLVESDIS